MYRGFITPPIGFTSREWYLLPTMTTYLHYRAGPEILEMIRDGGLDPETIRVFAAPAGGPKWFVSVGFDRALMKSGFLRRADGKVLLAGSSAGAWRCITMASKNPEAAHERLRIAYSRNTFTRQDSPQTISDALRRNVDDFLRDEDIPSILDHPTFDVAVHVVRAKGPAASETPAVQGGALLFGALCNAVSPRAMDLFFERVVFFSGDRKPEFVRQGFRGTSARLSDRNLREVALATGSLPYIIAGVRDIPGAGRGVFRDGGLVDYQLNQDYHPGNDGITLFFHYQERIVPGWFDKALSWRKPPNGSLNRVLQVFPGEAFLRMLPDGRLPDREDFKAFVDNPAERIRRWDLAADASGILGEEFLNAVESGAIQKQVAPLRHGV